MAGVKGKSGGARTNTRLKAKTADPEVLASWKANLHRAITSASSNGFVVRKESFFTTADIKRMFGKRALVDFKEWFEASKHFNQQVADQLFQEKASGKLDDKKFARLFYSTAFFWVWSVKPEKQKDAWSLSRGLTTLEY